MSDKYIPWPLTASLSASSFELAPTTSDASLGWAPSCTTPSCASTATWSTGRVNSTLKYSWWGWDATIDGSVQGDMDVRVTLDGNQATWSPSNGTLFSARSLNPDQLHSISFTVLNASPDARLSVSQARINGSTFSDQMEFFDEWSLNSDDKQFSYTGFVQQQVSSPTGSMAPVNYVSSSAGDSVTLNFNGSAFVIFGPCGPSSGLMRVNFDGEITTVNTTKPIQADDCMLHQSKGVLPLTIHQLVITNEGGGQLGINRMEFLRVLHFTHRKGGARAGMIVGIVLGVVVLIGALVVGYSLRSRKTRQKINRTFSVFCS